MRVFFRISNCWVVYVIVEQKRVEAQTSKPSKHCSPKEESIVPIESHEVESGRPSKSTSSTHLLLTQHLLCVFIERNDKHKGKADTLMNSLQVGWWLIKAHPPLASWTMLAMQLFWHICIINSLRLCCNSFWPNLVTGENREMLSLLSNRKLLAKFGECPKSCLYTGQHIVQTIVSLNTALCRLIHYCK